MTQCVSISYAFSWDVFLLLLCLVLLRCDIFYFILFCHIYYYPLGVSSFLMGNKKGVNLEGMGGEVGEFWED